MRLLFIMKRFPQQRDLLTRPYGRFFHLPSAVARLGHQVKAQLVSHRRLPSVEAADSGVQWSSHDVLTLGVAGLWQRLKSEAGSFRPDWIIGCSDAWYGWLAHRLSRQMQIPFAVDAYDNFEAYMPWNLPLHWKWRQAVAAANAVTATGPDLAAKLGEYRRGGAEVDIVPMAPDPVFRAMDRGGARRALALPLDTPLVGYLGSWSSSRGTRILLEAFELVRRKCPEARLVLSGRAVPRATDQSAVISLGYLEDRQVPLALNALNVACVITANSSFGRYSYPAKLCEAMACGVPVVATGTGPVRWMLKNDSRFIANVDDAHDLARRILANLDLGRVDFGPLATWEHGARKFESVLSR